MAPLLKYFRGFRIRQWLWLGAGTVWIVALVVVAIPQWRSALERHREVKELEVELADLDSWTVAGKWLALSVAEREGEITEDWQGMFPATRDREELFLKIARVADSSGVEGFTLKEILRASDAELEVQLNRKLAAFAGMGGAVAGVPVDVPHLSMNTYRVKATFVADYDRIARFLGGINRIDRALNVHSMALRPEKNLVRVDLELDVYVSKTS